jgi:hypothetical protein
LEFHALKKKFAKVKWGGIHMVKIILENNKKEK